MPLDLDRIIDHQLYLASQQCIQPCLQGRVSSARAPPTAPLTRAAAAAAAGPAGGQKPSPGSPVSSWGPSDSSRGSAVFLFDTAPISVPLRGTAAAAAAALLPRRRTGSRSGPSSSDTENWTSATATGRSGTGSPTGLDTTVDDNPAARHRFTPPPAPRPAAGGGMATSPPPPAPARPGLNRVSAITLLVQDLALTKRFYEHVFDAPCIYEDKTSAAFHFNGGGLVVNLCEAEDARREGLLGPAVPVGRSRDAGRRFQLSVWVDDVGDVYRRLRGVGAGGDEGFAVEGLAEPTTRPWGMRVVTFCDPAGHCWEVAQNICTKDG